MINSSCLCDMTVLLVKLSSSSALQPLRAWVERQPYTLFLSKLNSSLAELSELACVCETDALHCVSDKA